MRNMNPGPKRATRIRATCPDCGEVELGVPDVTLRATCARDHGFYGFICPSCTHPVNKPADERVVALLIGGGVEPLRWDFPAELLEQHGGIPLTYDDILDLHLLLDAPDFWERLAAAGQPRR